VIRFAAGVACLLCVAAHSGAGAPHPRGVGMPVCLEGHPSVRQEYAKSWAVFTGRVLSAREVPPTADDRWLNGTMYTVGVRRVMRGTPPTRLDVFSENSSGRFPMDRGVVYLLFVYHDLGRYAVDNCGNSAPLSQAGAALDTLRLLVGHR